MADIFDEFSTWTGYDTPEEAQQVNALEISFDFVGPSPFYICDYGQPITLRHEDTNLVPYDSIAFHIEKQEVGPTTQQDILIHMDGMNGQLYSILKSLTPEDRQKDITITYRTYLDTMADVGPAFVPPPQYILKDASANFGTLKMIARGSALPNQRSGLIYTPTEFKTLYFT